jgi:hypothetical protein
VVVVVVVVVVVNEHGDVVTWHIVQVVETRVSL